MESSPYNTKFSSAILTSVFAGIITTLLCFAYYVGYKEITGFPLSGLINVSSLIFIINTFFLVVGYIYFVFIKNFRRGDVLFVVLFVLLTALSIWQAYGIHRSDNPVVNMQFHQLLAGIFLINGVVVFAGIPFLFHNRKFNEAVI
jgi:hypothetical protein